MTTNRRPPDVDNGQELTTRRQFLKTLGIASVVALEAPVLASCAEGPPTSPPATVAPEATKAPEQAKAPEATKAPEPTKAPQVVATPTQPTPTPTAAATTGAIREVPRERTFVVFGINGSEGKWPAHDVWNTYSIGASYQNGEVLMYEFLAYYSAFADKEYMWLAEGYEYSPDFKELTIKTRSGITWSDGVPFSAADVAYTLQGLKEYGPKVQWGVDVQQFVEDVQAVDDNTVKVQFKIPSPRFFNFMTAQFGLGIGIVPKHIFEKEDWTSFTFYDPDKGLPISTSPWKVAYCSPEYKYIDRRDDWWAVKAGLVKQMPAMERIIMIPYSNEQSVAQAMLGNQGDNCYCQVQTAKMLVETNPALTTHSGKKSPYGYQDWWPLSLYVNCSVAPWSDKDVRWALSYFLDREQIIEVGYDGHTVPSYLPMPTYKPLQPYHEAVADLLEKYPTQEFNPAKGEALLSNKGWKKDSQGMWTDSEGKPVFLEIIAPSFLTGMGPIIAEQLKRQGIDAEFTSPPNIWTRLVNGEYTGCIVGHGGSLREPYDTLRLFTSSSRWVGQGQEANWNRWSNAEFDSVADEVYITPPNDVETLKALFYKAMEIWLPELPDIQLVRFHHNIVNNTTYWKNWPSEENPYINECTFHYTYQILLNNLEAVK